MDSEPVRLWREKFKLNLSRSWKADVEKTVKDLPLWKEILDNWFYFDARGKKRTKHPGIKGILDEYERLAATNQDAKKHNGPESIPDSNRPWLSAGGDSDVSEVPRNPERLYFGVDRMV